METNLIETSNIQHFYYHKEEEKLYRCIKCGLFKPKDCFHKNKSKKNKIQNVCKECSHKPHTRKTSCVYCGKEFIAKSKNNRFCSIECLGYGYGKKSQASIKKTIELKPNPVSFGYRGIVYKDLGCWLYDFCLTKHARKDTPAFSCGQCDLANPKRLEEIHVLR